MQHAYKKYFKRLSKKAKIPSKEVAKIWEKFSDQLEEEGYARDNKFFQMLNERVQEELEIKTNLDCLDKFKKYLQ